MLITSLGETRTQLINELNGERDAFGTFIEITRTWFCDFIANIPEESGLNDAINNAEAAVEN